MHKVSSALHPQQDCSCNQTLEAFYLLAHAAWLTILTSRVLHTPYSLYHLVYGAVSKGE